MPNAADRARSVVDADRVAALEDEVRRLRKRVRDLEDPRLRAIERELIPHRPSPRSEAS